MLSVKSELPQPTDSPAAIRWSIVFLLMTIALISHVNRVSIATAGDTRIMEQFHISPTRMGVVYSAFLLTYTLFMIPGGLLIDRLGTRPALMLVCFGSALFVALTGVVGLCSGSARSLFLGLLVVRGLMGVVSAPLHPACARTVGHWVPPRSRSRINGMINGSALVGIAATPPGFGALIDRWSWPVAFLIMSVVTLVLALVWTACAREHPEGSSTVQEDPRQDGLASGAGVWFALLRHRSLMLLTIVYGTIGYFQYMFFYWMSYYFETVLHLPEQRSHFYAAIPPLAMAVGMPLGGWISDRLEHARNTAGSRKIVPMFGMLAGAVLLIGGVSASEPAWIVTWFALALGAVGMAEGPSWATAIELGGRRGGSSAALFNTGGNAGGILAPIITPRIGETLGWGYAVSLGALICLAGLVLWIWIDPHAKPPDTGDANERTRNL
jgi:MFS family permease